MSDHPHPPGVGPGVPAPDAPPVCPRHPGVVSYVRCQRCNRPSCPACQRPAAVGVQCVDCVKESAKAVRSGRTVFGGTVTDGRPLMTQAIIAVCVGVFALQQVSPSLTGDLLFAPYVGRSEPWRFLTSAFVHGGIMHIAFNMYALWVLGGYLEFLLGRARFLALYLISAVGGSTALLLMARTPDPTAIEASYGDLWFQGAVGASGAVFGLFAAFLVLNRHLGRDSSGMIATIAINLALPFFIPGIAWQAHVGGFLTGGVCALAIARLAKGPDGKLAPNRQWLGLLAVFVLLVVAAAARYAVLPAGIPS